MLYRCFQEKRKESTSEAYNQWMNEWGRKCDVKQYEKTLPQILLESRINSMTLQTKARPIARYKEIFLMKLRTETWFMLFEQRPCKCGLAIESVKHIMFECELLDNVRSFNDESILEVNNFNFQYCRDMLKHYEEI